MAHAVKEVSDGTFEGEVLKSDVPVLVDFWAPWCGPCRMVAPILEELAQELAGKVKITKLNVDDNQDTAGKFQVMAIPTLLLFKGGQVVGQQVGALRKDQLTTFISEHA